MIIFSFKQIKEKCDENKIKRKGEEKYKKLINLKFINYFYVFL